MAKPRIHAMIDAKRFGGTPEDYQHIHEFLDSSKCVNASNLHRVFTHNSWFISAVLPRVFGETFPRKSDGKIISVRDIGESHMLSDFRGSIPSAGDYLNALRYESWIDGRVPPPSARLLPSNRGHDFTEPVFPAVGSTFKGPNGEACRVGPNMTFEIVVDDHADKEEPVAIVTDEARKELAD